MYSSKGTTSTKGYSSRISSKGPSGSSKKDSVVESDECEAVYDFVKNLFYDDHITSLRYILKVRPAAKVFMNFLRTENTEVQLEFYLEAKKIETLSPNAQADAIVRIYNMYIADFKNESKSGKSTNELKSGGSLKGGDSKSNIESKDNDGDQLIVMRNWINQEVESTLRMLAKNAFPRFLVSPYCRETLEAIRGYGNVANFEQTMIKGASDWFRLFISLAECMPCCMTIADMTIPGVPLVYANQEFCRVSGYSKNEILGHNCRFLQGPQTEPEAIQVIRNNLSKGQDCHVKITNYRKNGDIFQNALSMRTIFDSANIYRYVIGIQYEVKENENLNQRLIQLDKLLRMIPSHLPYT